MWGVRTGEASESPSMPRLALGCARNAIQQPVTAASGYHSAAWCLFDFVADVLNATASGVIVFWLEKWPPGVLTCRVASGSEGQRLTCRYFYLSCHEMWREFSFDPSFILCIESPKSQLKHMTVMPPILMPEQKSIAGPLNPPQVSIFHSKSEKKILQNKHMNNMFILINLFFFFYPFVSNGIKTPKQTT